MSQEAGRLRANSETEQLPVETEAVRPLAKTAAARAESEPVRLHVETEAARPRVETEAARLRVSTEAARLRLKTETARLRLKTWLCAAVVVLSNVFGNFFLKRGMPADLPTPLSYITALFQPWAALGVALLVLWLVSRMTLLSWADLSYVLPVTSIGYVLVALTGKFLLHEQIAFKRWAGIVLIMSGVALVSLGTAPQSEQRRENAT